MQTSGNQSGNQSENPSGNQSETNPQAGNVIRALGDPLFEEKANQEHDYQLYFHFMRNRSLDKWTRDASKTLLQIITKDIRKSQRQIENRARLLQRYKREALSKQSKAQKAWCDQFKRD